MAKKSNKADSAAKPKTSRPVRKKASAKRAPAKPRTAAVANSIAAKPKRKRTAARSAVTSEDRAQLVAVAAYLRAEQRGFAPGGEQQDWLLAEREVDERLGLPRL